MKFNLSNNPLNCLVRTAWAHSKGQRGWFVTYVVLSMASMAANLGEPLVVGRMLNLVQSGHLTRESLPTLFWLLAIFVGLNLAFWSLHGPSRLIERTVAFSIRMSFQMRLFNTVVALPVQWHQDNHSGAIIDRTSKATNSLFEFCEGSFDLIQTAVRLVGSLAFLCFFMPLAGAVMAVSTVAAVILVVAFDRVLLAQYEEINRGFRHVAEAVHDYFSNVTTIISLRLERNVSAEVFTRLGAIFPQFRKNVVANEWKWFLMTMLVATMMAVVLGAYCYREISAERVILAGTFFTLFEYLRRMTDSFYGFADKYGRLVSQAANVRAIEPILRASSRSAFEGLEPLSSKWQTLEISNLSFAYAEKDDQPHFLRDVGFTLQRGKSIAFVGESGCGKSTLLSVLRGLHEARTVNVTCDGQLLPNSLQQVAQETTLIPQEPEIFANTIRFNVAMGLNASEAEILDAVRLACFDSVLARLPRGLDTNIAEKGVNLSGGEKQRLALARGIFFARQSSLVLLDEPTSSVDVFNERVIYKGLLNLFREKCVVSAVHKFHLLPLFDNVFVFAGGRLVEHGTFKDLLAKKGELYRLWSSHSLDDSSGDAAIVV